MVLLVVVLPKWPPQCRPCWCGTKRAGAIVVRLPLTYAQA